ncbi:hypothetical protein A2671_02600 [Candidatus Kaiserbacteria bacterium RIFCSPHIGHO2_01_FULL_49_13]|uniref:NYN domain-containing protein n=1 Tax=Candidatus Kaiserbacteria bacterium RIFCSPHIGHO2_01_FULL_49_13 TaxID=1798477 RepID=A0A1F6CCJ2_9BACT|nr:MAG: hypothetical protein A2671_02600 [Candidatus Kaiserbacteria bacterium RIFCSPHIGHO2_01_FULL_49_13]
MESSKGRVAIYIDGGNFYQRLREAGVPRGTKFNYSKLVDFLLRGRTLVSKRYYVGIVRNHDHTDKSQQMVEGQQKFLSKLEGEGFTIKRGRIVYDHKIREKGVDVKIAIDLIVGAVDNLYDTAVVVSSDTDLIPAIKYAKFKDKKVEYVGFSAQPSLGMARESTLSVLLLPDDLQKFTSPGEGKGTRAAA